MNPSFHYYFFAKKSYDPLLLEARLGLSPLRYIGKER